tara:strand:+ start:128 stop:466 length:339 start_codon:yes stop_codon:yes gene_type:complete
MLAVMENPLAVAEVVALVLWVEMPLEILVGMAEVALLQQILSSRKPWQAVVAVGRKILIVRVRPALAAVRVEREQDHLMGRLVAQIEAAVAVAVLAVLAEAAHQQVLAGLGL